MDWIQTSHRVTDVGIKSTLHYWPITCQIPQKSDVSDAIKKKNKKEKKQLNRKTQFYTW